MFVVLFSYDARRHAVAQDAVQIITNVDILITYQQLVT